MSAATSGADRRPRVAAVDCGTNSTRLLIAGPDGEPVERLMRITRLGEGVDVNHRLSTDAIARTVAVLKDYRDAMDVHGVTKVRMAATSAARDAENRDDFFDAAAAVIGATPELLGGAEEGRLSFRGATHGMTPSTGPWLVADIGGGSTEIAFGPVSGEDPLLVRSLDIGCVRVSERFLRSDPPSSGELRDARAYVTELIGELRTDQPVTRSAHTFLGLAGTVAALAAIEQGLDEYDRSRVHHHTLSRGTVEELLATLAMETVAQRRRRPGVEHDRADVIVGGTVILAEIMHQYSFDSCLTSEADILDGMAMSLLT